MSDVQNRLSKRDGGGKKQQRAHDLQAATGSVISGSVEPLKTIASA
jgi:hypothetical protein